MPVVNVNKDLLFKKIGKTFSQEQFEDLCFQYGIELDDMVQEENGQTTYKIEVAANRYDMLCIEGLVKGIRTFLGLSEAPEYKLSSIPESQMQKMVVLPESQLVRPFIVCGILRNVKFDQERYQSFIDLQDKLHGNLCRHRSLVSIGTHDLKNVKGPFQYSGEVPNSIQFIPLKQNQEFQADKLLKYYEENDKNHLGRYVHIIRDSIVYPVLRDSQGIVLSLPPIINGSRSQISLDTTDVLVEVTATDLHKASIVLNIVCCLFSEYSSTPYQVEPVLLQNADGSSEVFPKLEMRTFEVDYDYISSNIGVEIDPEEVLKLLKKMELRGQLIKNTGKVKIKVEVPPTRSDILHAVDVVEDIAIAYGFNNLGDIEFLDNRSISYEPKLLPMEKFCMKVREEMIAMGYTAVYNWALCQFKENFDFLRRQNTDDLCVKVGNPQTVEFEICRTTLLTGMLKTLNANKDLPLPIKTFEISDIVHKTQNMKEGAQNIRHICACITDKEASFDVIQGALVQLLDVMDIQDINQTDGKDNIDGMFYQIKQGHSQTYLGNWQGEIYIINKNVKDKKDYQKEVKMGEFGVLHPLVLSAFDLNYPVSCLELALEPLL